MDISLLLKAIFDPQINRSALIQQIIKPGDVFDIKIIEVKDDQRALVDFGKFRALAKVQFPVRAGADFVAKVTDTAGQLRLQVIEPDTRTAGGDKAVSNRLEILSFDLFNKIQSDIKQAAQHILHPPAGSDLPPPHISRALAALDAHFASLNLNQDLAKWLPLIKSYIENTGFFFEKKMADLILQFTRGQDTGNIQELIRDPRIQSIMGRDLKPILLMLKAYLDTPDMEVRFPDAKELAQFKGTVDMLLSDIHNQQSRAVHKHELADPYQVFSFTLPLKENEEKARLKLYCPKKKSGSAETGFKISLLLELNRIGELRTDFFLLDGDLSITFFVKDDASKTHFEHHYKEIRDSLNSLFNYLVLKTVVSEKKIQEFHHADLDIDSDRQVDLRI
jgi:UDP-N-acetylglucosamine transferase subunit ALG13